MKNSDFQKKRYEDFNSYDYEKNHGDRIKKVLSLFEPCPHGRILDIGCGDGYITQIIGRKTGAEMHGCDISRSALKDAEKKGVIAAEADLDGGKLPYQDKYFDAVFAGEVIEHVFDTDTFIEEIRRVLKDGGYLVLTTPNLGAWYNRIALLFGWQPWNLDISNNRIFGNPFFKKSFLPQGHIKGYTYFAIRDLLNCYEFKIIRVTGSKYLSSRISSLIDYYVSNHFPTLCSIFIIKARR